MARRKQAIRVLITDANELAGLGAVRSLGRAGYLLGTAVSDRTRSNATQWSRYAGTPLRYPDPWKRPHEFREWLMRQSQSGDWDVVLPNSEAAIVAAAEVRAAGVKALLVAPADHLLPFTLSKYAATGAAEKAGVPCPETQYIGAGTSDNEIHCVLRQSRFPLILKTDNTWTGGTYRKGHTYLTDSFEQAVYLLPELRAQGDRFIVQEQIKGFGVGAFLLLRDGLSRLRFAHRRLHEVPFTGGYSSYRVSTEDPEAIGLSERLLTSIGYDGVAMVEFRRDPSTGRTYFLEINGRLWGSIALALHAGVDFPAALVSSALGEPLQGGPAEYPVGLRCRHTPGEIGHVLSILKASAKEGATRGRKMGAIGEFLALSLNPGIRHDHFWWSDPLPGLYQAWDSAKFLSRRVEEAIASKLALRRRAQRLAQVVAEQRRRSQAMRARSILFLCYGNICRSPFAGEYWNRVLRASDESLPEAMSAGFHSAAGRSTPEKIAAFVRRSFAIELSEHRSRRVSAEMLKETDVVFVMDFENYEALEREFPEVAREKTFFLGVFGNSNEVEIEDPYLLTDPERVEACYEGVRSALHGFAAVLAESHARV